jgi:hypothetical protein
MSMPNSAEMPNGIGRRAKPMELSLGTNRQVIGREKGRRRREEGGGGGGGDGRGRMNVKAEDAYFCTFCLTIPARDENNKILRKYPRHQSILGDLL